MSQPVDLLLITCNRRDYVERMLPTILNDPADFRLYCWDNGSQDGTADLLKSLNDPRIVKQHFNSENIGQYKPCMWFFEESTSDVLGKIDDDILLPEGWTQRISHMIRNEPRFGMLGCWIFMPEDWDETISKHNIVKFSNQEVFRCVKIQGQSFLCRKEYLLRYQFDESKGYGFPIDGVKMSIDGLINGYPVPLMYAHNMDDPRSPMNKYTKSNELQSSSSLTARKLGFESIDDYIKWIKKDALNRQMLPFEQQLKKAILRRDQSFIGKIKRKLWNFGLFQ